VETKKYGKATLSKQKTDDMKQWMFAGTWLPTGTRQKRRSPSRKPERQRSNRKNYQQRMNDSLRARTQPPVNEVGVGVANQKQYLEKQHAGGKNSGCAPEPRKNIFCYY